MWVHVFVHVGKRQSHYLIFLISTISVANTNVRTFEAFCQVFLQLRLFVKFFIIVFLYRNRNIMKIFSTKLPINRKLLYKLCSIFEENTVLVKINR